MQTDDNINDPMENKENVKQSNDERIDQDFPGYPDSPSTENLIKPENTEEKITAGAHSESPDKDGTYPEPEDTGNKNMEQNKELKSDGSAGAFGGTEEVRS